jgi:hypothetical protein
MLSEEQATEAVGTHRPNFAPFTVRAKRSIRSRCHIKGTRHCAAVGRQHPPQLAPRDTGVWDPISPADLASPSDRCCDAYTERYICAMHAERHIREDTVPVAPSVPSVLGIRSRGTLSHAFGHGLREVLTALVTFTCCCETPQLPPLQPVSEASSTLLTLQDLRRLCAQVRQAAHRPRCGAVRRCGRHSAQVRSSIVRRWQPQSLVPLRDYMRWRGSASASCPLRQAIQPSRRCGRHSALTAE